MTAHYKHLPHMWVHLLVKHRHLHKGPHTLHYIYTQYAAEAMLSFSLTGNSNPEPSAKQKDTLPLSH